MVTATPRKGRRAHSNVVAGTSAVLLVSANSNRKTLTLQNQSSITVYIGPANVTTSGSACGYALYQGQTFTDNGSDQEWWGIASNSANINIIEVS